MFSEPNMQVLQDKIDQLNTQAWDVRVFDSLKSLELSRESVQLSRIINYKSGLAHGLKCLGFSYIRVAKNDEALPVLQEALTLFESLADLKGKAVVYGYLAIIQRNWGDFGNALELFFKAVELSEQTAFEENAGTDYYQVGVTYKYLGNFEKALDWLYKSLSLFREINNRLFQSYPINIIGSIYFENEDYTQALAYYQEGLMLRQESQDKLGEAGSLDNIGFTYFKLKDYHLAINYCTRSLVISENTGDKRNQANAMQHLAEIYKQADNALLATKFSNDSLQIRRQIGDKRGETEILLFLASLHKEQPEHSDKIFNWYSSALNISEEIKGIDLLSKTRFALYGYYRQAGKFKEAIEQLELHNELEKELHKNSVDQKIQNLEISHKAEEAKKETDNMRIRNKELNDLNAEIREQKEKLETSLSNLKSAQAQLIQSEKMASLGELTAGIAHEIQNPLNFVNNFSEINKEMLEELKAERLKQKAERDEQAEDELINDVIKNEEKINHHGKRADAIVKNMLQHSRSSSALKEPADINALADEYLRLSYHGLRAKDKTFNATINTDFDSSVEKVNIIPQNIGRVLLNLYNNAFYTVQQKQKEIASKELPSFENLATLYEPTVSVTTKKTGDKVEIKVSDNGNGIPEKIVDKIFQPFFTTKPTGQGTGLGLSLSYDIIKGHGGDIKVESKVDVGTTFIIQLPITA